MKQARHKSKSTAQTVTAAPGVGAALPALPPPKRGRPRKHPLEKGRIELPAFDPTKADGDTAKALTVFRKAMADAERATMTPALFDGGGTAENAYMVTKDSLQRRVTRRLNVLDRFLTDEKLVELLAFSSLKEIGIYEGILLDKSLVLQGQPNVIIGSNDRTAMASVLPRLMDELKRRNLIASASQSAGTIDVTKMGS